MRLVWKGRFKNMEQLPVGRLPERAIMFKEPKTPAMLNLAAGIFVIPALVLIVIAIVIKASAGAEVQFFSPYSIWGLLLAFLMVFPHEFLHAIAFPKEAEVEVWYSIKNAIAFVVSTCPTTKRRFIFLGLLPSLVFGLVPLILWILIPFRSAAVSDILFSFSAFSLMMGAGDYLNVFNALTQMPKNAITQLSGFHSYWYLP